jgi:hypothetical protein
VWYTILIEFFKEYFKDPNKKEVAYSFRIVLLVLLVLSLGGQVDIKKNLVETRNDLMAKISGVERKLDEADEDRKLVLKEYNDRQREIEGRLSFLEAANSIKKWRKN